MKVRTKTFFFLERSRRAYFIIHNFWLRTFSDHPHIVIKSSSQLSEVSREEFDEYKEGSNWFSLSLIHIASQSEPIESKFPKEIVIQFSKAGYLPISQVQHGQQCSAFFSSPACSISHGLQILHSEDSHILAIWGAQPACESLSS